jgi:hypothetical protein
VTNQQKGLIAGVFIVAVVGGGILAFLLFGRGGGGGDGTATAIPTPSATASALVTSSPEATESPTTEPSATTEPTEEPTPTVEPTATPTPPPPSATKATVTQLKLDAKEDPDGHSRRISWRTAGTGPVKVSVKVLSPRGQATMCMSRSATPVDCITTADGSITSRANVDNRDFAISLIGAGGAAPVVDVTLTFPARTPSIMIERARFDGTDFPETNGIQVIVEPRRVGDVTLDAEWGESFSYEVDLFEQGGDGRSQEHPNEGPALEAQVTFTATTTNPWKLVLQNIEAGSGRTELTATIGWP